MKKLTGLLLLAFTLLWIVSCKQPAQKEPAQEVTTQDVTVQEESTQELIDLEGSVNEVTVQEESTREAIEQEESSRQDETALPAAETFGKQITPDNALPAHALVSLLNPVDTILTKVKGNIVASCKHSGCWMDVDLGDGKVLKVNFLNDGFVIPKDAAGKTAILAGRAWKELIPVDILRHYAEEQGKSREEIEAITEPAWKYSFIADGVIIQ